MGRRHSSSSKANSTLASAVASGEDQRATIERLLEKGNAKEAFKLAKLCFHKDASAENRLLVERTSLFRLQTLIRGRMFSAGREVAGSLLEFGVADPGLREQLVLLLPQVGLGDKALTLQGALRSPDAQAHLLKTIADQAVLRPEEAPASLPELRAAAGQVRAALAALDAKNDSQALELLQPIPRSSPVADWRYFVRGLIAFQREDLEQARANWDRLEPHRAARKIAEALLAGPDQAGGAERPDALRALELSVFQEPILDRLAELRRALGTSDWKRVLQIAGPLRQSLHRIDPRSSQRLTDILLAPLAAELAQHPYRSAERMLKEFKAALEPLAWDPQWNRFHALLWEAQHGGDPQAISFWQKYSKDLDQGIPTPFGTPRQVQARVWQRIGLLLIDLVIEEEGASDGSFRRPAKVNLAKLELQDRAIEALKQSLQFDATQKETYALLVNCYTKWEYPNELLALLEQMLQAFPDDPNVLRHLIKIYEDREEPEQVLTYLTRLRGLQPLDATLNSIEAGARIVRARQLALKKRWEEGRAEFARLETLPRESVNPGRLWARRAAFELKAGEAVQAATYLEQARAAETRPAVLFLTLAIEAVRYKLSKPLQKQFNQEFKQAAAEKATSETAGGLAEAMMVNLDAAKNYTGRAGHITEVVRYLKRTARLKYEEKDLRLVCGMLHTLGTQVRLLKTLLTRGKSLFPKSPLFICLDAELSLDANPPAFRIYHILFNLKEALTLAQASQNPEDQRLIPIIKQTLARAEELQANKMTFSFGGAFPFGPGASPTIPQQVEDLLHFFDDDDLDVEEPEDAEEPPPRSRKPK